MDIVVNEEHVQLLISMGFPDDFEVRRALKLAKNDINEAVSFLTNEVPGLHDVEMTVPLPSSSNDNYQTSTTTDAGTENMEIDENVDTLEFPATHLYELESRVFTSSWSIPYKKEESLGRCLNASIRLAKERLTESDENCRRFLENCMPACFDKLMTAYQVNRWGQEVQEGIFQMLQLFIDLICLRLQYDPVPTRMMDVLSLCLDPNTNYHQKNSRKLWDKAQWESEFGYGNVFAESSSQFDEAYGYLISLINRFAAKDGFDQMVKKFESKTLTVFEMFFILKPFGFCVDFLNAPIAGPVLRPCIDFVIENFPTLSDIDGKKGTSSSSLVDLMGYVKILLVHLHKSPEEANRVDDLRLSFVLKLLKSSNFGLRMNALKELTKLLEMLTSPNKMDERLSIGSDKLSQWLSDNEVLSLALEGNIDQAQYCDRLRTLLVFLGPRLSCQDVTKIWSLRRGRAAVTVDNVHTIVTQAATKFGRQELDHLLLLIQKSWNGESERSKEKLVILLGKIGLDTSVSYTYEQIAEILWKFAHQKISIALVNMCLEEHLNVATVSGRDTLRLDYINRCLNDIKEGSFVLPAMAQLHGLVESIKKSGFNAAKSQKTVISDLVNKRQLVESLCDNLIRMHNLSFQMWQQKTKTIIAAQPISLPPTTLQTVSSANTSSLTVQNLSIQMPGSNIPSPDQRKVEVELEQEFGPDFLLPNGFTYGYHVDAILDFLRFVLVAGELFLLIHRCQELWDTLIADSNACSYAREAGFSWFLKGINDLEKNCQMQLFQDRMLKLDPTRYTSTGFACFRRFFESVNSNEQKLRLSSYGSQSIEVEKPDLIGSDYLWQMSLNSANDDIAKEAIDFLISLNYVQLSNRLKKDPANLHKKFLSECYRRLESAIMTLKRTPVVEFLNRSAKILAAPSVPAIIDIPEPDKHQKIRNIERLLLVAETYVKVVENSQQPGFIRVTPSHGSSYFASSFTLITNYEDTTATPTYKRENVEILVDENETLGMIRERLAAIFGVEYARLSLEYDGKDLPLSQDHQILKMFGITTPNDPNEKRIILAKRRFVSTYVSSYDTSSKCSEIKMVGGFNGFKQQQQALEQERNLPAVMMAQDRQVFEILYQLVSLEEPGVTTRVRELLLLIPSDSGVSEILDNLTNAMNATSSKSNSLDRKSAGGLLSKSGNESSSISEKLAAFAAGSSPKSKHKQQTPEKEIQKTKESAVDMLKPLLDLTTSGLNPFRLLYNLEVLSGRVLPTSYLDSQTLMSAQQFANGFIHIGGVQYLINILKKDSLPPNTEPSLRQNIYERVLQLLNYLLCEESTLHAVLNSQKRQIQSVKGAAAATEKSETSGNAASSSTSYASGAKATADETAQSQNAWLTLEPPSSGKAAKDLTVELFAHVLETLQRLSWAAAGGILHLIGSDLKSPNVAGGSTTGTPWFLASPRSRTSESSTGSSDSETPSNLHSGVSSSHTVSTPEDIGIAVRSLRLLTDCLLIRPHDVQIFFNLPHLSDYVLDVLLVTDSLSVRRAAQQQFLRIADVTTLCFANLSAQQTAAPASTSSLNLRKALLRSQSHQSPPLNASQEGQSPRFLLFTILLRAPLPLWTLSSNVRGSTQRFLGQCGEYFALRGRLLAQLGQHELASIQPSPGQMLDDEVHWILGFSCSASAHLAAADNVLLTGHLELVAVLLGLMPESKPKVGQLLIEPLLDEFLFPSAKLANRISQKDENSLRRAKAADIRAKCQKQDCRAAAYALLLELCKGCVENYRVLTKMLCTIHHQPCPELLNEWDYSPLVEAKMDSGFVGLKNAGATCYMNAVLQQFLMEPGLAESILSVEVEENDNSVKLLRELQRVFGHLKESEQQYYVPKTFWEAFKFWGQQVNPREQQDAFDFFTCLISQIDEILKKNSREEIFRQRYQGVFSDQKICQGCPHRYESEEPFYALNLPVRVHNLEESLNNFVKGEILEGDNAYFCEKCGQKRTALKRTCIKSLPPVVVIQMKRFGYDWEENRSLKFNDFFQFPLQLDFFPYTSNALVQMDTGGGGEDLELGTSPSMSSSPFTQFLNSPSGPTSGLSPIAAIGTPTGRPRRHTARLSLFGVADAIRYELVGVIVHSGQANAGHYYAYIKDRRDDAVINGSFNRWFKFNDTTVELVEMTDQFMEIELFGGKYTAKTDKNSMYPEERERYWNAYLLFYRRLGSSGDNRTPKMSTNKRSVSMSCSNTPQNKNPRRRDSLMELAELVEQGEQLQLFGNDLGPPAWLRQEIQEENFKFARNRDVFNSVYFSFAWRLLELACPYADSSIDNITNGGSRSTTLDVEQNLSLACAEFSLEFLVNTAWHCKKSLRGDAKVWTERLISLLRRHPVVCQYFAHYFVDNCHLLKEFLLDCQSEDVRQSFGNFVTRILFECILSDDAVAGRAACASLLESLLSLVGKEAVERWQNATALFHIFYRITCISAEASKILLEKQAFNGLLNFMLQASSADSPQQQTASLPSSPSGAPPAIKIPSPTVSLSRRWSVNQAKQFSDIYTTLAKLMMQCDFSAYYTVVTGSAEQQYYNPQSSISDFVDPKLQPVPDMIHIAGGDLMAGFVRELVWAACNVNQCSQSLCDLMCYLCWRNDKIGRRFVVELLVAMATTPSNDLKPVFTVTESALLLSNDDTLQQRRTDLLLDGCKDGLERVEGLLALIKSSQTTDSRRSYGCVKFLVKASEKSLELKAALNKRLEQWQWAVDWLKTRMEDEISAEASSGAGNTATGGSGSSDYGSSSSTAVVLPGPVQATSSSVTKLNVPSSHTSNEDSTTRQFQRTVSAQYTLDQANAMLKEFENSDCQVQPSLSEDALASPGQRDAACVIEMGDGDSLCKSPTPEPIPDASMMSPPSSHQNRKKDGKKTGGSVFYIDST